MDSGNFGPPESWWFHSEVASETGDLIAATTAWLRMVLMEKT